VSGWWWDVPEFVAAQEDPGFRAWVDASEGAVDLCIFQSELIPELPPNIFEDGALSIAEKSFMDRFPDMAALRSEWNTMMDYAQYVGQYFVHNLEARLVWQPKVKGKWETSSPALEFPWPRDMLSPLIPMLNTAVTRRTGSQWDFMYRNNREVYRDWKRGEIE
jgi:hypothetical protein